MEGEGYAPGISFQPMRVLIDGHGSEGNLVLADGQLPAVFVRLDGTHHGPSTGKPSLG